MILILLNWFLRKSLPSFSESVPSLTKTSPWTETALEICVCLSPQIQKVFIFPLPLISISPRDCKFRTCYTKYLLQFHLVTINVTDRPSHWAAGTHCASKLMMGDHKRISRVRHTHGMGIYSLANPYGMAKPNESLPFIAFCCFHWVLQLTSSNILISCVWISFAVTCQVEIQIKSSSNSFIFEKRKYNEIL